MIAVFTAGLCIGLGLVMLTMPTMTQRSRIRLAISLPRAQEKLRQRTVDRHRADLALTEHVAQDMVVQKLVGGLIGSFLPIACGALISTVGANPATSLVWLGSVVCGLLGFMLPDRILRNTAQRRRKSFLHAFSSFLDLTNVLLAGGAGTETALLAAADAGDGWAFEQLRNALVRARSSHHSPWVELAALGERFNLTQVIEVAGSVQLAGEHGARIRSSLSAKAESLRHRQMSEIEAAANSSTERMGMPMVLLFLAFIVLIGYPAVTLIVGGL
jgi:Flp pilus assembly protein TadB